MILMEFSTGGVFSSLTLIGVYLRDLYTGLSGFAGDDVGDSSQLQSASTTFLFWVVSGVSMRCMLYRLPYLVMLSSYISRFLTPNFFLRA